MAHDSLKKKEVEIFFKTNKTNVAETARRFKLPYTTVKTWIDNEGWIAGSAIENIDTTSNEVVTNNFNLVTHKAKENIKNEIIQNLGSLAYDVDSIVLSSLLNESSESLLIQAMSLNHINKSLALNASIAKNALMQLNANNNGSIESNMAVIACSEKVSKIFNDLKTSLYGRDVTIVNNVTKDYSEMSDAELLEMINREQG